MLIVKKDLNDWRPRLDTKDTRHITLDSIEDLEWVMNPTYLKRFKELYFYAPKEVFASTEWALWVQSLKKQHGIKLTEKFHRKNCHLRLVV